MIVAAHVPALWPPSPTQGTPSGPGSQDDLSLRAVQRNPDSLGDSEPQFVSAGLVAGHPGEGAGKKHQGQQER